MSVLEKKIRIRQRGIDLLGTVHVVQIEMLMIDYDTENRADWVHDLIRDQFAKQFPRAVQDPFLEIDRDE